MKCVSNFVFLKTSYKCVHNLCFSVPCFFYSTLYVFLVLLVFGVLEVKAFFFSFSFFFRKRTLWFSTYLFVHNHSSLRSINVRFPIVVLF